LIELQISLGEQRLLVFLAAQREEGSLPVATSEAFPRNLGFTVRQNGDAFLVLVEFVTLVFEVEDCPVLERGAGEEREISGFCFTLLFRFSWAKWDQVWRRGGSFSCLVLGGRLVCRRVGTKKINERFP